MSIRLGVLSVTAQPGVETKITVQVGHAPKTVLLPACAAPQSAVQPSGKIAKVGEPLNVVGRNAICAEGVAPKGRGHIYQKLIVS